MEPLAALAQRIVMLPFEKTSASRAAKYVKLHREKQLEAQVGGDPTLADTLWFARMPSVRITRAELLAFPETAYMRKNMDGSVIDLDVETDDQEGMDDGQNAGVRKIRPRLERCSLVHVLAMRGFDEALKDVISFIPEANRTEAMNAPAQLTATLKTKGVSPLHALSIYAPDVDPATGHGNVIAAQLLLQHGANFSAMNGGNNPQFSALVFAGARGSVALSAS